MNFIIKIKTLQTYVIVFLLINNIFDKKKIIFKIWKYYIFLERNFTFFGDILETNNKPFYYKTTNQQRGHHMMVNYQNLQSPIVCKYPHLAKALAHWLASW